MTEVALNDEQRRAVFARAVPLLVVAIAGAGKTRVLIERIRHLVKMGVDPTRILAVTFSVKAAREMAARLDLPEVRIGTFHSLALQIVRGELVGTADWRIDDTDRYRICIKDAVSFRGMAWQQADVTYLSSFIGRCKAEGAAPDSKRAVELATAAYGKKRTSSREPNLVVRAYAMAEEFRRERCLLTFDDLLVEANRVLETDEGARVRWATRWDHVLQDEAQDENAVQHALVEKLARDHRSYTIVGDPSQAIFSFRGASPAALLSFERDWGAEVVRMATNYRCGSSIVELANAVLRQMPPHTHLGVEMVSTRPETGVVRVTAYDDFDAEGDGVAEKILESHEDGLQWRDHVVLFRTNAQSRGVEEQMLAARIPYVVLGGTNFYNRREVRDLLSYLRIAAGIGTYEDVKRSINTPFRFLGRVFVDGLEAEIAGLKGLAMIEAIRSYALETDRLQQRQRTSAVAYCQLLDQMAEKIRQGVEQATPTKDSQSEICARPATILDHLVHDLKYNEWLTRDEGAESPENNRVSNVRELVRAAGRFPTVAELLQYVDETIARAAQEKHRQQGGDVVTLCSIHRAKGLEWPVVHLIGANQKILPHAYAEDESEERRLFYVAATRARDVLEISYVRTAAISSRVVELQPSQYLHDVGMLSH